MGSRSTQKPRKGKYFASTLKQNNVVEFRNNKAMFSIAPCIAPKVDSTLYHANVTIQKQLHVGAPWFHID